MRSLQGGHEIGTESEAKPSPSKPCVGVKVVSNLLQGPALQAKLFANCYLFCSCKIL